MLYLACSVSDVPCNGKIVVQVKIARTVQNGICIARKNLTRARKRDRGPVSVVSIYCTAKIRANRTVLNCLLVSIEAEFLRNIFWPIPLFRKLV